MPPRRSSLPTAGCRRTSCRSSVRWRPPSGSRCGRSTFAASARPPAQPEPELVLPEQPEGQRSTSGNPLVACLSDAIRFYMEFHRLYDQGYVAHVHDAFAACAAVGRTPFTTRLATVDVETDSPVLIGTTVADFRGLWGLPPNARIVADNNPGALLRRADFLDRCPGTRRGQRATGRLGAVWAAGSCGRFRPGPDR